MVNILSKIAIFLLDIYKKFISPLLGGGCRFYPSCSEYARWNFEKKNFFVALYLTILRILRCNPLSAGGIEYPIIKIPKKLSIISNKQRKKITYFIIPIDNKRGYLVKIKFKI